LDGRADRQDARPVQKKILRRNQPNQQESKWGAEFIRSLKVRRELAAQAGEGKKLSCQGAGKAAAVTE